VTASNGASDLDAALAFFVGIGLFVLSLVGIYWFCAVCVEVSVIGSCIVVAYLGWAAWAVSNGRISSLFSFVVASLSVAAGSYRGWCKRVALRATSASQQAAASDEARGNQPSSKATERAPRA
jgi:hypothetical protein